MRITGEHTIRAPREQVWAALHDPAVLARTLPGVEQLEVTGEGRYQVTVTAGVASIRGTYHGDVELTEAEQPEGYRLRAAGAGGPGTISADARIRLADVDGQATLVSYDADAIVGGTLAGVGQRMVTGVSQRTAGEFFDAVERELTGAPAPAPAAPTPAGPGAPAVEPAAPGTVFRAPPRAPAEMPRLLLALLAGAAIALAGVLVGRRTAR